MSYQNLYNKEKYDRITVFGPKGIRNVIKYYADLQGLSMNQFVGRAVLLYVSAIEGDEEVREFHWYNKNGKKVVSE